MQALVRFRMRSPSPELAKEASGLVTRAGRLWSGGGVGRWSVECGVVEDPSLNSTPRTKLDLIRGSQPL